MDNAACTGSGIGPYDRLYAGAALPWPDCPGRMVTLAARLRPAARGIDLGCGDGKNLLYLERLGWTVDGVDSSRLAIRAAGTRLRSAGHQQRGTLTVGDVAHVVLPVNTYDLALVYGLYHCMKDDAVILVHERLRRALRVSGLVAIAVFTDMLPVPDGHPTALLTLRPLDTLIDALTTGWKTIALEHGEIEESHEPLLGMHRHSVMWALLERQS